jgi:hypothetical protein
MVIAMASCLPWIGALAQADEIYTFVVKKQEAKAQNRWSLGEWLETRDKMRLMDLWLALHSPSPYEFYLGGEYQFANTTGWRADFAAFASIFGLGVEHESQPGTTRWNGTFLIRAFGYHAQATNLTLHGGIRSQVGDLELRNAYAGATLTLYLARFFGIDGGYRHQFASVPGPSGIFPAEDRYEAGAFLDFKVLRLYGKYFAGSETGGIRRQGPAAGLRFFF